jgi:acetylornithine deacetylase/succinyl-diaminopimelate desuccinylase-like protein
MNLELILKELDESKTLAEQRLFELLRFESISTNSKYKSECFKTAEWLVKHLEEIGFSSSLRKTDGNPMVVAHSDGKGSDFLFYGHYDVQPVDPEDLWKTKPFEPVIQDTTDGPVIRARGAADDKGQLMTFLEACRAIKTIDGELPCKITILFEGEEETSSPSLIPFLQQNVNELKAKYALVCDTGMWDSKTPSITSSLRGMLSEEITVIGPNRDLHSGLFGGAVPNPLRIMSNLISNLHTEEGTVNIPNFYEGVEDTPSALLEQWKKLGSTEEIFLKKLGLSQSVGEYGCSYLEKLWSRPTCEINGLWGGYIDEGFKTVIPSKAHAKISFRLVGQQDPENIRNEFRKKLKKELPPDFKISFSNHKGSKATQFNCNSKIMAEAKEALTDEWEREAVFVGGGGSIPIVKHFKEILDMDTLLVGFSLDNDQIHSPNEKYNLTSYHKGARSWVRILNNLSKSL